MALARCAVVALLLLGRVGRRYVAALSIALGSSVKRKNNIKNNTS